MLVPHEVRSVLVVAQSGQVAHEATTSADNGNRTRSLPGGRSPACTPVHGVVRWRRIDLQRVIVERFGIAYHERTVGKILKTLGFSHISGRPCHPAQDGRTIEAFKNFFGHAESPSDRHRNEKTRRDLVPGRGPDRPEEWLVRQWAKRGTRPRQPADQRYESAYLFGAICPARGTGSALA